MPFVEPRYTVDLSQCWFYHTMELPQIGLVEGQWDLRGRTKEYLADLDVSGRTVLDVGAASGFLSFEMERMGARVTSLDAERSEQLNAVPFQNGPQARDRAARAQQWVERLPKMQNSYWLAHRLNNSSCRVYYGDIYNLQEDLGQYDVVVIGQILVHLRDPVGALISIANRCAKSLVIAEGMDPSAEPIARFYASLECQQPNAWWRYSQGLYRRFLPILGFEVGPFVTGRYKCNALGSDVEITSVVATRP